MLPALAWCLRWSRSKFVFHFDRSFQHIWRNRLHHCRSCWMGQQHSPFNQIHLTLGDTRLTAIQWEDGNRVYSKQPLSFYGILSMSLRSERGLSPYSHICDESVGRGTVREFGLQLYWLFSRFLPTGTPREQETCRRMKYMISKEELKRHLTKQAAL